MNASSFIAGRLSQRGANPQDEDRLSRVSHHIAWISVALSVAVMIVAVAVVDGFKSEIRAKATGFMGSVVMSVPGETSLNETTPFSRDLSYIDAIDSLDFVSSVSGVAYRSGMIKGTEDIAGLYFKGVDSLYDFSFYENSLVDGALPRFSGRISSDILISRRLADQLNFKVGDKVSSFFVGEELKARSFVVCGIFDAQLEDIDKSFAIIDLRQVQRIAGWEKDQVSDIEVRIFPDKSIDDARDAIADIEFSRAGDGDQPLFCHSVKSIYANLFDWLALLDLNVVMILVLMMAVAGFNMISAILIILFRKISMIGLLKSLGMNDRSVSGVFLRVAARIVGKGLVIGNILALAICFIQKYTHLMKLDPANYFVSFVPITLHLPKLLLLDVVSAVVIILFLTLTTIFISRVSPARNMAE